MTPSHRCASRLRLRIAVRRPQQGKRWVVARRLRHTPVGALAHLSTPRSGNVWAGAGRERRETDHVPGHVPTRRGHRDGRSRRVTARAAHRAACDPDRIGPRPASGRLRPERPKHNLSGKVGGAGAKQLEVAEGLRKFWASSRSLT